VARAVVAPVAEAVAGAGPVAAVAQAGECCSFDASIVDE
jgi:hypothetical protein